MNHHNNEYVYLHTKIALAVGCGRKHLPNFNNVQKEKQMQLSSYQSSIPKKNAIKKKSKSIIQIL